jgi:dihydrofolate reductase
MRPFDIIAAVDAESGLGKDGDLAWHLPGDMAYFKAVTSNPPRPEQTNVVIMGRKTWDSIPARFQPLKNRINIVVTRQQNFPLPDGAHLAHGLDEALALATTFPGVGTVFVVGGGSLYAAALSSPSCRKVYLTHIAGQFDCDTLFPQLPKHFREKTRSAQHEDNGISYSFVVYENDS